MNELFNENNYHWCINCGKYSMDIIYQHEDDYKVYRKLECVSCGEQDFDSVDLGQQVKNRE